MCCPDITTNKSCPRNSRLCGKEVMVKVKEHFELEETQIFGVSESAACGQRLISTTDALTYTCIFDDWIIGGSRTSQKLLSVSTRT